VKVDPRRRYLAIYRAYARALEHELAGNQGAAISALALCVEQYEAGVDDGYTRSKPDEVRLLVDALKAKTHRDSGWLLAQRMIALVQRAWPEIRAGEVLH